MTPLGRALLSGLTLFGGHFVNRRHDRVGLIGGSLTVAVVGTIGVARALPLDDSGLRYLVWLPMGLMLLVGLIALISAGLTFRDARQSMERPQTLTIRVIRLPVTLFGVLIFAFIAAAGISSVPYLGGLHTRSVAKPVGAVEFGNSASISIDGSLPDAPSGSERLRGRITLQGVGIRGAQIALVVDDRYEVERLTSDSRGAFEASLPAGKWRVNGLTVDNWEGRPKDRDLILFSPHEPMEENGSYSRDNSELRNGLEVMLPQKSDTIPLEVEFRDALSLTWPPREGAANADFATAAIAWQPISKAAEYEVQICNDEHDWTKKCDWPVLMRRISSTSLPLASLPQRSSSTKTNRYFVHVFAFDAQGRLLTESGGAGADRTFELTGATRLGKEQGWPPKVITEEFEANEKRLDEVESLLRDKRFEDARSALDRVTKDAEPGRATALLGRLAALQGDCVKAKQLFDQAEKEGACVCAADRQLCELLTLSKKQPTSRRRRLRSRNPIQQSTIGGRFDFEVMSQR